MKKSLLIVLVALANVHFAYAQTKTVTTDANDILNNNTKLVAQTSTGQIFFTGHQIGASYFTPSGIFRAITDNVGGSNYFYDGVSGSATTFSVRSDGQGYFAGKMGIGTTAPKANLHVVGNGLFGGGNLDPAGANGNLNYLTNSGQFLIGWNRTAGAGETDFIANQGAGNTGGFAFYNHDNNNTETQLMWVLGNGQVLIGNSQGKQGNYLLAVAGSAVATSFTVKTVAYWPDYVFKPSYTLPSLTDVKTYIDQNHHLPEIPSEADVAKDGVNLGEMNRLLLKKVEELTLYLIEKDKEDSVQKAINSRQQLQINTLILTIKKRSKIKS